MTEFIDARENDKTDTWNKPLSKTGLEKEIAAFWANLPEHQQRMRKIVEETTNPKKQPPTVPESSKSE